MSNQASDSQSTEEVISNIDAIMGSPDSSAHPIKFYNSYSGDQPSTAVLSCPLSSNSGPVNPEALELIGINASVTKPAADPDVTTCPLVTDQGPSISQALGLAGDGPLLPGSKQMGSIPKLMELRLDPRVWRKEDGESRELQEGPPRRVYLPRSFRPNCWNCDEPGHERSNCPWKERGRVRHCCYLCGFPWVTARTCPNCGPDWFAKGPYHRGQRRHFWRDQ